MITNKYLDLIENNLNKILNSYHNEFRKPITYSLFGGKMLRGQLLLIGLNDLKINIQLGVDIACALEMIQAYTLVHDDLPGMDDDDYRRGKLSNHKVYGEGIAILVGDTLLNDAINLISNINYIEKNILLDIIKIITSKLGGNGMILGQYLDLTTKGSMVNTFEVTNIRQLKTVNFFELVFIIIGLLSNVEKNEISQLEKIGNLIGHAFQIKDDLDDHINEKKSDIINNRPTITRVDSLENIKKTLSKIKNECINEIITFFGQGEILTLFERMFYEY
ncbi:MAG: polyprenyl synthetase family protein [Bacilli bacterium]|jgi:geranylgeranyl diphosphate synthase type II